LERALRADCRSLAFAVSALLLSSSAMSSPAPTEARIITEPEGAEVLIGDVLLGVTTRYGLRLTAEAAGTITFTVRKVGYVPVEKTITIERGATRPVIVVVRLEPSGSEPKAPHVEATPPKTVGPSPPTKVASPRPASEPAKGGSHTGLILGAIGGAAAVGVGAATLTNGGGSSPTSTPSAPTLAGTYVGTAQDSARGTGSLTIALTHSGSYVTGTWRGAEIGWRALNGTTDGSLVNATLLPSVPTACPYNLTASVSGNRMTGTYVSFNCAFPVTGAVDVTRR
jgi:hypothetical protein